ncbi:MAG: MATE family efflux transporter [Lachnospiraceae bacterium]|nr:MATE family efflux transporter [Lachnospiraceae bacterium]
MKDCDLGTGKIETLIRKFSIPCVISMVVAALYNIVDQIFIGWSSAGAYGNAATNIVYPFTVFALGVALLVGDGAAAGFSISLGMDDKKQANKNVGNGLMILICGAVVLCVTGFVFRTQILGLFGGDPKEAQCYGYATDYFLIICAGLPFYMVGQGLNGSIRADGSPKFAMACTLAGALTNLILDPVFIFGLSMGVKGAALATITGQGLTFAMSIFYLTKSKNFHIDRNALAFERHTVGRILSVGMASLIVQLSIVVIIAVNNNLLVKYGYETMASTRKAFGAVIPLAVVGIVMKVFGIVISIIIGISLGGQPIIGFNMGAGNTERVKQTIQKITKLVLLVGVVSFLIFEIFPGTVISLFGSHNTEEYMEYARLCIRIFLGGIILTCYIKSAAIILQSMGNSVKSTILALLRDVIVFVPTSIVIATISRSIVTMLWSAVFSDVVAAIVALVFVSTEIRKLEKSH